jgi:trimeric autotransporter adhesin
MKKVIFIFGIGLMNFAISQNEWNVAVNSPLPNIYRTGNIGIGNGILTGPTLPIVVKPLTGGSKISFGSTALGAFGGGAAATAETSLLEITGASPTTGAAAINLLTAEGNTKSHLNLGISQTEAYITSGGGKFAAFKPMKFYNGGVEAMSINSDGSVGIGIPPSYPVGYKLYVTGGILTEKVKVAVRTTSDWMDFVFDKEYKLMSIEERANFISKNKHLPGIPSAEEVVKDGIDLQKMDAKLLEQIECLNLYIIKMNQELKDLRAENKLMNEKLESLMH